MPPEDNQSQSSPENVEEQPAHQLEEAVGVVVDHIMTTKKIMEGGGQAYQSIVPLKSADKKLPEAFVTRLYELLQIDEAPYLEQTFPFYYKNDEGELTEGEQLDRRFHTKLDHVNIMEVYNKRDNSLLESHVVIGPVKS